MLLSHQVDERGNRFFSESDFLDLYRAFLRAFSDYVFPFALTEAQFRNHIRLNAVDLERSVGRFEAGEVVGFSLNGFGSWHDIPTVYDAGTGVVPEYRRTGIGQSIFDFMIPEFKAAGLDQFLLEVITANEGAVRLYEKLGFTPTRELALLQCDQPRSIPPVNPAIDIREMGSPEWKRLCSFWRSEPSWQNSVEAVERTRSMKCIFGAFLNGQCAGYIVFSSNFGRVSQLAVDPQHYGQGVGAALLDVLQRHTADGYSLQAINVDKSDTGLMRFFRKFGFYERLAQYEMVLDLSAT